MPPKKKMPKPLTPGTPREIIFLDPWTQADGSPRTPSTPTTPTRARKNRSQNATRFTTPDRGTGLSTAPLTVSTTTSGRTSPPTPSPGGTAALSRNALESEPRLANPQSSSYIPGSPAPPSPSQRIAAGIPSYQTQTPTYPAKPSGIYYDGPPPHQSIAERYFLSSRSSLYSNGDGEQHRMGSGYWSPSAINPPYPAQMQMPSHPMNGPGYRSTSANYPPYPLQAQIPSMGMQSTTQMAGTASTTPIALTSNLTYHGPPYPHPHPANPARVPIPPHQPQHPHPRPRPQLSIQTNPTSQPLPSHPTSNPHPFSSPFPPSRSSSSVSSASIDFPHRRTNNPAGRLHAHNSRASGPSPTSNPSSGQCGNIISEMASPSSSESDGSTALGLTAPECWNCGEQLGDVEGGLCGECGIPN